MHPPHQPHPHEILEDPAYVPSTTKAATVRHLLRMGCCATDISTHLRLDRAYVFRIAARAGLPTNPHIKGTRLTTVLKLLQQSGNNTEYAARATRNTPGNIKRLLVMLDNQAKIRREESPDPIDLPPPLTIDMREPPL